MDKPVYRISASGHCARALSAERLGKQAEEAPKWLGQAAEEGNWHEKRIKEQLQAEDVTVVREQEEVVLAFPLFELVGHIDGTIFAHDDIERLLEVKSMSQYEFDRWMRGRFNEFPNYAAQLACYFNATLLGTAQYIVKNRNSGYIDKQIYKAQNFDQIFVDTINKLTIVENAVRLGNLVEIEYNPNSIECKRCGYKALCIPEPKEMPVYEQREIQEAVNTWRRGMDLTHEGEELVDLARGVFKHYTEQQGINKWQFDSLSIALTKVHRESYEKKELLKLFTAEQLAPALKTTEFEQLRVDDLSKENGK